MSNTELKPCPFCGGEGSLIGVFDIVLTRVMYKGMCKKCLMQTNKFAKREHAEKAWNERSYE